MRKQYFRLAARAARYSSKPMRVGAVVVRKGRVVSFGTNSSRTHPKSNIPVWKTIHAEQSACLGVPAEKLEGSDIYVARLTKTGKYAMSKPCTSCEAFLREVGVKRAFFTTRERDFKEVAYG